jgi:dUTP pyrophosphatase
MDKQIIKIKKLVENFTLPTKGNNDDSNACYDVIAYSIDITEDYIEYGLGFSTEISKGYKGVIVPRSSISKYDLIQCNSPAQIDSNYRGEWKVRFKVTKRENPKIYKIGDRVAQIYFEKVNDIVFQEVETLSNSDRGDKGFGSTGK